MNFVAKISLRLTSALLLGYSVIFAYADPSAAQQPQTVMIFTATFGKGHDEAAKNIKRLIEEKDPSVHVVIKNVQDFMPDNIRKMAVGGFDFAQAKAPTTYTRLFNFYMWLGGKITNPANLPIADAIDLNKFRDFIAEGTPSVIINTWPHGVEAVDRMKDRGLFQDTAVFWTHTDPVTSHTGKREYFENLAISVDRAFVPSERVRQNFIALGVPPDKVITSGMPIQLTPRPPLSWDDRQVRMKATREKLGIPVDHRTYMIEAGKNGVGNYPLMIGGMVHASGNDPITIIAATGENKEQLDEVNWLQHGVGDDAHKTSVLQHRLSPLLKKGVSQATLDSWIKNGLPEQVLVKPLGFTPLQDWRVASDAVATKAGGLSTNEMAADNIFMVLNSSRASGQELSGVEELSALGLAADEHDEANIGETAVKYAKDTEYLKGFSERSENYRKTFNVQVIAEQALAALETGKAAVLREGEAEIKLQNPIATCLFAGLKAYQSMRSSGTPSVSH